MTLEYGLATLEELPRIVEMKLAMFQEACHEYLLVNNANAIVLEDYSRLYSENQAKHFVARAENRIIASVGAFVKSDLPYRYFLPGRCGFIGDVYTELEYRGKGIATHLNETALAWLRTKGVREVRLLASDAGRLIYEKLGFTASEEMVLTFSM